MLDENIIYTWLQSTRHSGCTAQKTNLKGIYVYTQNHAQII